MRVIKIVGETNIEAGTLMRYQARLSDGARQADFSSVRWKVREKRGTVLRSLPTAGRDLSYGPTSDALGTVELIAQIGWNDPAPQTLEISVTPLDVPSLPTTPVKVELDQDPTTGSYRAFSARVNGGGAFLVGRRVAYARRTRLGLALSDRDAQLYYDPSSYEAEYGAWAGLFASSVLVEGGGAIEAVNSYDLATFSYGLIQFAAHVYGAGFHQLLRAAFLKDPVLASYYFPFLQLDAGKEFLGQDRSTGVWKQLTTATDPKNFALRTFIKPASSRITREEIDFAARLIHWTRSQKMLPNLMVELAVDRAKQYMRDVEKDLDGKGIALAAMVFDIRNNGRGGRGTALARIRAALNAAHPMNELALIHDSSRAQKAHVKLVLAAITKRYASSRLVYDQVTESFIEK
ncbi:hypothetical protein [Paraburkholderia hospita]|uniref:hypothetical protein n=1 Tax=Paraburkholderia hospita TaxID=169430 RepID=UPI003ECF2CA0